MALITTHELKLAFYATFHQPTYAMMATQIDGLLARQLSRYYTTQPYKDMMSAIRQFKTIFDESKPALELMMQLQKGWDGLMVLVEDEGAAQAAGVPPF
jgi:hypothetical protein